MENMTSESENMKDIEVVQDSALQKNLENGESTQSNEKNDSITSHNSPTPMETQEQTTSKGDTYFSDINEDSSDPTFIPKNIQTLNYVAKQLLNSQNVVDVLVVNPEQESSLPLPFQDNSIPPNNTIYINHLNEKITVNNLRIMLTSLCSKFGDVLRVNVHDAMKRKGQAWVVFDRLESAIEAVEHLHGMEIDGKRIGVQFAKTTSDPIAMRNGTFELQKRKREIERKMNAGVEQFQRELKKRRIVTTYKKPQVSAPAAASTAISITTRGGDGLQPHHILLVQGLSDSVTKEDLEELFSNFPGFKQVRYIGAKKVAFVDFDSEQNATLSLDTDGMKIKDITLQVTYAKK